MSSEEVREKIGFDVMTYRMEYHGLCSECKAKTDQNGEYKKLSRGGLSPRRERQEGQISTDLRELFAASIAGSSRGMHSASCGWVG